MADPVRLLLYSDPLFERHETGEHPECAERLRAIRRRLAASRLLAQTTAGTIRAATAEELGRVHPAPYQETVRAFARQGGGHLDPDTIVSPESADVAVTAAGTACAAVDEVMAGRADRALCLSRPPGHHALPSRAMGFCLFNNIAVAAAHARAAHELDRVLIVDWDVHHGNGTQDIFYEDGAVHFLSAHRYPFYPGTGAADETGSGPGLGAIHNVPLKFGISRVGFRDAFRKGLEYLAERSRPQLVLISAGFDAHANDPIGSLGLESEDFGRLTEDVLDVARAHCGGRVVSVLEGGYGLDELAESVECHLSALLKGSA
ncbi:MAG: histone deacetylase [Planctomycetaceae bacterium]|nr:histone deacetylase [Planctomycetaceae bacterium]